MHAEDAFGTEVECDLNGLFGGGVKRSHDPPWGVGAYADEGEVEGLHVCGYLLEDLAVGGVAGEVEVELWALDGKAGPQSGVFVEQATATKVDRWEGGDP